MPREASDTLFLYCDFSIRRVGISPWLLGSWMVDRLFRQVKSAMRGASTLPVYSFSGPKFIPGIDWSDHLNYWEAGYKAVMVSDTAIYRNANYHTAQDTANTLDYHRMAMVVQGVYQAVVAATK